MSDKLKTNFKRVRNATMKIVVPLEIEDFCMQPAPHVSPPKWHLAHTTWFYERLILEGQVRNYKSEHPEYYHLFNSYYKSLGSHWVRSDRGNLSRPTVKEIMAYRENIDQKVIELLRSGASEETESLITLGLNHEQQHQELLFMDIKNIFFNQYGGVSYLREDRAQKISQAPIELKMVSFDGGLVEAGIDHQTGEFSYDNESPKHKTWLNPFTFANRLVTNADYLEFVQAQGYENPELWLSDGWIWVNENKMKAPLYWVYRDNAWQEFGFTGLQPLNLNQPLMNISYYEAQAYARFKGLRLPTEFEWEYVAQTNKSNSQGSGFLNYDRLSPQIASSDFSDLHGSVWQWTQSAYLPYPGHKWIKGPLGEYNSKFMINQMVLRGGCFATESDHYRPTYRNYFYPNERWAFTGLRLAGDL